MIGSPNIRPHKAMTSVLILLAAALASGQQSCDPAHVASSTTDVEINNRCYNDTDEHFSLVGGVEQSGVASLPNQTNAFMSAFTRAGLDGNWKIWARIRLLGAPTASTGGVISAFQDPSGQIKNLDTQKVGQAVDYVIGTDYQIKKLTSQNGRYSMHIITMGGATTPLSSEDVIDKFKVPDKASPLCGDVITRFSASNGYPAGLILPNTSTDPATASNCLANGITVLEFNRQERSNFLRKYAIGIRTITRFMRASSDDTPPDHFSSDQCCERGIVDFTVGQDESITGGLLRGLVFRVDGIHPLPIKGKSFLYLFGTAALRAQPNQDFRTIILDADTSGALPSAPNVALLPLKQPNKDFYRFGVALDIGKIFTTLFGS